MNDPRIPQEAGTREYAMNLYRLFEKGYVEQKYDLWWLNIDCSCGSDSNENGNESEDRREGQHEHTPSDRGGREVSG